MAEEGEHPNTEEPMNTQELLNTMAASQIQLREDVNCMMQQFQNSKSNQKEDKTNHDPSTVATQVQDANSRQIQWDWLPKVSSKDVMRAIQPLGAMEEVLAQMFKTTLTGAVLR
ncbi:hypothetical protein SO802_017782 [Lithocarpus litseifolius]|uniref:Uncharacterized protein n=1 Tax=Lithocarpus litseifolius TaxID=425828 RepID=A0AAW2CNA4_9ROSI